MGAIDEVRRVRELINESSEISGILGRAARGKATIDLIKHAIALIEKQIAYAKHINDGAWQANAERLRAGLSGALTLGIEVLRQPAPPSPELMLVEEPLARHLIQHGHVIRRQFSIKGGRIDIYDVTRDEIIECKVRGTGAALGEAASQLRRYRRFFPGSSLAIAVTLIEPEAEWLSALLQGTGIRIIEVERGLS